MTKVSTVFWYVTQCSLGEVRRRFGGSCQLAPYSTYTDEAASNRFLLNVGTPATLHGKQPEYKHISMENVEEAEE
jgi:hypothetical protein